MDKQLLARVEKQAWFHKHPRGLPLLLFVVAVAATLLGVLVIERAHSSTRKLALESHAAEIASALERRASENVAFLNATAAVFSSRNEVSPQAFADFADQLNSGRSTKGALGMGWAKWLDARDVPELETKMHEMGMPDFKVRPRPKVGAGPVVPVIYVQPLTRYNRKAIGFDVYSEPGRRAAINRAIVLEQATVSGRIELLPDGGEKGAIGFLIFTPVFAERTRELKGFVYSPFKAADFLDSAIDLRTYPNLDVAIFDQSPAPGSLLAMRVLPGKEGMSVERNIHIGTRDWVLRVADRNRPALSPLARLTLVFGSLAAVLLTVIGRLITRRAAEDRLVLEWLTNQSAIRNSLTRELNHRVKNTLANVISIVSLTRRRSEDIDEFAESLTGRVRALSATHDLLSQSEWSNAPIGEIVRSELAPYMGGDDKHVEIAGPDVSLAPNDALSLGLVIHELATNAAKYGALSTPEGKVEVTWHLASPELVRLSWRESGGPPVRPPARRGFGTDLIEKVVAHELDTAVDLRFEPTGVVCSLTVPVRGRQEFALRSTGQSAATGAFKFTLSGGWIRKIEPD